MPDAALIIGIQTYPDSGLPSAPFAATDAAAFAQTMTGLGIEAMLLTDAQATRTALASRLRKLIKTPPDRLFVWFGGLAFHDDGDDFLACHDLQADDRPDTAMALRDFLAAIKAVKASKTFVFLDPRGGAGTPMDPTALDDIGMNVFASYGPGEASHVSGSLKAGLWAHLVAEAFAGRAALALAEGGILTTETLCAHLLREMPRLLRATYRDAPPQTPAYRGVSAVLAHVAAAMDPQQSVADPRLLPLKRGVLRGESRVRLKSLTGYRKFHRLPDRINEGTRRFVAELASADVQADVDLFYASIRELLGYKRRDVEGSADRGSGFVRTPDFEYSVIATVADDDPSVAVFRREVGSIQNPEVVLGAAFGQVFGEQFDTLVFEYTRPFDLEAWVDRIEEEMPTGVKLRCAPDCSSVEVMLPGLVGVVRLLRDRVEIVGQRTPSSRGLVEAFLAFQDRFHGRSDLPELPLVPGTK